MKMKRFTEEQIVRILWDGEAGRIEKAARQHGVSEQPIYRWKRQFGQMPVRLPSDWGLTQQKFRLSHGHIPTCIVSIGELLNRSLPFFE